MGFPDAQVSISLVDDATIAELGSRFGRPRRATDVLAFSMLEGPGAAHRGDALGDVVISIETAERQASGRGVSLDTELRDLLIHGVLHLVGMDHASEREKRQMRRLEEHLRWEIERSD